MKDQRKEVWVLAAILMVALINGVIYLYLMPPWQHYDEPNHFEYAWYLANRPGLPGSDSHDPLINRLVVESMIRHDFFNDPASIPDLSQPLSIGGYSQFDEPPTYYFIASLPLRLLAGASVEAQLYAMRWVSLGFYLLTVLAGWGVARVIAPTGHPVRWLLPLSLALLPGLAELMTAANNDAAAIATVSLFLWFSLRLVQRGVTWYDLLAVVSLAGISYFIKTTAVIALLLLPLVLALAFVRGRGRRWVWVGLVLLSLVVLLVSFSWGDAAQWARYTFQGSPTRLQTADAPLGDHVFQLQYEPGAPAPHEIGLAQTFPIQTGFDLSNQVVTVGAWIWATQPIEVRTPLIRTYPQMSQYYKVVRIDTTPTFVSVLTPLAEGTARTWVSLAPLPADTPLEPVTIYFDGVVLANGAYRVDEPPLFRDESATDGVWGGEPFVNLLRNASAERAWPRLHPRLDALGAAYLPDPGLNLPAVTMYSILDGSMGSWYYYQDAQVLFRTFWGRFGWGHVPLLGLTPYRKIAYITLLPVIGLGIFILRRWRRIPWDAALTLGLALLLGWGLAITRGANYILTMEAVFFPVARYAYPVVIPTMLALVAGWVEICSYPARWKVKFASIFYWVPVVLLLILNIYALISILKYYA